LLVGLAPTEFGRSVAEGLAPVSTGFAPILAAIMLLAWILAETRKRVDARRMQLVSESRFIQELDWQGFERFVCSLFRKQGLVVRHTGRNGADGGVDIRMSRGGKVILVQCKHWGGRRVGVQCVRELLGVVTAQGAASGVIVASGLFSREAHAFARGNPIELIDGPRLAGLIRDAGGVSAVSEPRGNEALRTAAPCCPACGEPMVERVARKGSRPGQRFLGCTRFPACRGSRPLIDQAPDNPGEVA
jgi:restriction system protein